ncbi:hypothetical protein HPQ64_02775 [Rhizobiales bacterium]|uniref:hypothetical protein n=1 Tax=Hongsoonwoonella zoysiae TaxID=2821844 RepID=UPI00155F7D82|nr:hypothetical protein [Hongsoonwoonella zoysiae]NRG16608.1 hypothetical protein [Hongsoonwoonella zoysiae]
MSFIFSSKRFGFCGYSTNLRLAPLWFDATMIAGNPLNGNRKQQELAVYEIGLVKVLVDSLSAMLLCFLQSALGEGFAKSKFSPFARRRVIRRLNSDITGAVWVPGPGIGVKL